MMLEAQYSAAGFQLISRKHIPAQASAESPAQKSCALRSTQQRLQSASRLFSDTCCCALLCSSWASLTWPLAAWQCAHRSALPSAFCWAVVPGITWPCVSQMQPDPPSTKSASCWPGLSMSSCSRPSRVRMPLRLLILPLRCVCHVILLSATLATIHNADQQHA